MRQTLARIQEQLHTLACHPERVKSPQQDADAQTLAAIRLVIDLLPEEIRQQMTEILALRDQLHSPLFATCDRDDESASRQRPLRRSPTLDPTRHRVGRGEVSPYPSHLCHYRNINQK
jgi:hypothetical protein